ncbi:MAG: hypothetical protein NC900_04905 [Candidatus Omnitrophica bacterium]|nr:hypothetical protein [Candidatus Omnitrophota bacterium]
MKPKLTYKEGFSFLELILVSSLIPIISLAIYFTFSSGIKIYQKINNNLPLEEINIFLNNFYKDIKNTFYFKDIPFQGDREKIEFASLIYSSYFKAKTIGKVIYLYEHGRKRLIRKDFIYGQDYLEKATNLKILENISNLNFKYYYYLEEKNDYLWMDDTFYGKIPLAVRIEFIFNDKPFVYSVSIPIAQKEL